MEQEDCIILGSFPPRVREPLSVIDLDKIKNADQVTSSGEDEREASSPSTISRRINSSESERSQRNNLQSSVPPETPVASTMAEIDAVQPVNQQVAILAIQNRTPPMTALDLNSLWASRFLQIFRVKPIQFQLIGQEISQWVDADKIPSTIVPGSLDDPENAWLKSIVDYENFNEAQMAIAHVPSDERILHLRHCLENAQLPPYEPDPYAIIELLRNENGIGVQETLHKLKEDFCQVPPHSAIKRFVYEFEANGVKGVCAAGTKEHAKYGSALDFLCNLKRKFVELNLPVLNQYYIYLIEAPIAKFSAKFLIKYGKRVSCVLKKGKLTEFCGFPLYICLLTLDGSRQYAGWNYYSVELASNLALKMAYEVEIMEQCPSDAIQIGESNALCYKNADIYHRCTL